MILKCLFLILFLNLILASFSFAAMRVDNFAGNGLGSQWVSYADPNSHVSPTPFFITSGGHDSDQCARLDFELKQGVQYPFAGMTDSFSPQDLNAYEGVRFWAKGQGIEVRDRGRIPAELVIKFTAATGQ